MMADILESSTPQDWRSLEPESTLLLDLGKNRVVIELAPEFAPEHVANIRTLARQGYWNGLAVVRVNDNYVVQLADPHADDPVRKRSLGDAKGSLPPEFQRSFTPELPFTELPDGDIYASSVGFTRSFPVARDTSDAQIWLLHTYATVSAGREVDIASGNGSELTIVIGHAPRQLDRNVTVVGRVRYGMEHISSLSRGEGTLGFEEQPSTLIDSVRLAAEVPEEERPRLEVLRTDTPLFLQLIEARRNRHEDWFHRPAGHIEIGNVPLPVRLSQ